MREVPPVVLRSSWAPQGLNTCRGKVKAVVKLPPLVMGAGLSPAPCCGTNVGDLACTVELAGLLFLVVRTGPDLFSRFPRSCASCWLPFKVCSCGMLDPLRRGLTEVPAINHIFFFHCWSCYQPHKKEKKTKRTPTLQKQGRRGGGVAVGARFR